MFFHPNVGKKSEKQDLNPVIAEHIILPRCTYDAWKILFPELNAEAWENINYPYSVIDFIEAMFANLKQQSASLNQVEDVTVLPIGQEYLDWLEQNNREHGMDSYMDYSLTVSPEELTNLATKYQMDENIQCAVLPILATSKTGFPPFTDFHMSEGTHEALLSYFRPVFGEENVYIPRYYMKGNVCLNNLSRLYQLATVYFREKKNIRLDAFLSQTIGVENVNITYFYVPIFTYENGLNMTFPIERLYLNEDDTVNPLRIPNAVVLNDGSYAQYFNKNSVFVGKPFQCEEIKQDFPDVSLHIADFLVDIFDIPHFEQESIRVMMKNFAEDATFTIK